MEKRERYFWGSVGVLLVCLLLAGLAQLSHLDLSARQNEHRRKMGAVYMTLNNPFYEIVDEEISIGDYVLTGGELGALVLVDAAARLCDGVLPASECFENDSHWDGLLEYPQYTRPPEWMGRKVPDVLQSGHHGNIDRFRREQSLLRTQNKRPDLLKKAELTEKDRKFLRELDEQVEN